MKLDLQNISAHDVDTAYNFLADTDEQFARLFAQKDSFKDRIKIAKARAFLQSGASTAKEREMDADCNQEVESYIDDYENVVADYKLLEARRQRAHTVIDLFRTMESSRRRT